MPFQSKAQNAWAHTAAGTKALGGPAKVKEWEHATDYSNLPKRKGYAQGGPVEKGKRTDPQNQEKPHSPSIGGMNDGHGIFARGGPVINDNIDKHYKTPTRTPLGQFLSTQDRFTGGRLPAGFPGESESEEAWDKPKGVGHTDADDYGDCKRLKPVLPHASGGRYSYAK